MVPSASSAATWTLIRPTRCSPVSAARQLRARISKAEASCVSRPPCSFYLLPGLEAASRVQLLFLAGLAAVVRRDDHDVGSSRWTRYLRIRPANDVFIHAPGRFILQILFSPSKGFFHQSANGQRKTGHFAGNKSRHADCLLDETFPLKTGCEGIRNER
jgi:hypothetical protein